MDGEEGADAELTTLMYNVATRQIPLHKLQSNFRRIQRDCNNNFNCDIDGPSAVRRILSFPGVVDGYIPLHIGCEFGSVPMVKYLLELGTKVNVYGRGKEEGELEDEEHPGNGTDQEEEFYTGAGGLFIECRRRTSNTRPTNAKSTTITAMEVAMERVQSRKTDENWEVLLLCLQYVHSAKMTQPIQIPSSKPITFSALLSSSPQQDYQLSSSSSSLLPSPSTIILQALGILSLDLIIDLIKLLPAIDLNVTDPLGRNILIKSIHLAAQIQCTTSTSTTTTSIMNNKKSWKSLFHTILEKATIRTSSSPGVTDKEGGDGGEERHDTITSTKAMTFQGRHAVHIAAEVGLDWSKGLKEILHHTNYNYLDVEDTTTKLLPFMLAASSSGTTTTTTTTTTQQVTTTTGGPNHNNKNNDQRQLLSKILDRHYRELGKYNPWNDLYFHLNYNQQTRTNCSTNNRKKKKKKKKKMDSIMIDFCNAIRGEVDMKGHPDDDDNEQTYRHLFTSFTSMIEPQCNLDSAFEMLRQNPSVLAKYIPVTQKKPMKINHRQHRKRKRRKKRNRKKRK